MKHRYSEKSLFEFLKYFESDPSAVSRNDPMNLLNEVGYRRLPLSSKSEREFYLRISLEKSYLESEDSAGYIHEDENDSRYGYSVGYLVSMKGHEFLSRTRSEQLPRKWWRQIIDNVPTIIVSIFGAILTAWALNLWGPNPTKPEELNSESTTLEQS